MSPAARSLTPRSDDLPPDAPASSPLPSPVSYPRILIGLVDLGVGMAIAEQVDGGTDLRLETDVLIVGGGPAGTWAASLAARGGARVASRRSDRP